MSLRLREEQIEQILPVLAKIAASIGVGDTPDQEFLRQLLGELGKAPEDWALKELERWTGILKQVHENPNQEENMQSALEDCGVPEAPATLAVHMAIPPISAWESFEHEYGTTTDDTPKEWSILEPVEPYHDWLPDYNWHNDLDWEQLPFFIKGNGTLIHKLRQGEEVNSQNVSYKLVNKRLIRKLHDDRLAIPLKGPLEAYREWLPDHQWHADLDWFHTPLSIQKPAVLNALLQGKAINTRYVSYKVANNRLMRKLHDSMPVLALEPPRERFHMWLPDHKWHDDLTFRLLPPWIKNDPSILQALRQGRQVSGKYVTYKIEDSRIMRKLKDRVPVRHTR